MKENVINQSMENQFDLQQWWRNIESVRRCPDWSPSELPIDIIQTHISVVLRGQHHVLKLKKPVNFGFLDYTTLDKRRDACRAEVELNRRLCPDTYVGVQSISLIEGQPRFSDQGEVIEYGVMMKRLPTEQMLDRLVARADITDAIIERIAERLSRFHRDARHGTDVNALGVPEVIARNWEENFEQTAPYVGRTILSGAYDSIKRWVMAWLSDHEELLRARVTEGRIRDGHGDIRTESICVTNGICIFDCIEFNERFRFGDVTSEVAFLAMDLDARGRPDLGYFFSEQYEIRCLDPELFELLPFYRCYSAYVRGKVHSFRLDQPESIAAERDSAALRARRYFDLALRYTMRLSHPTVIAITGLAGTGKTSLARAIAGEFGLRTVSSDAVRKALFEIKQPYAYSAGPYSADVSRLIYQTIIERGRYLLRHDAGVVFDATFRHSSEREIARKMAIDAGAEWRVIECRLEPKLIHERLDRRAALKDGLSDATWETYLRQQSDNEPLDDLDRPRLELDMSRDLGVVARLATDWLREQDISVI